MNNVGDATPQPLCCRIDVSDGFSVDVDSAGNYRGCPDHTAVEHTFDVDGDNIPTGSLAALLDHLEPHARDLNPRTLLECRFFGPCGQASENL